MKKAIHKLFARRHFWRQATFSEVAELYMSRILRVAAMHMAGAFMAIYMYQNGFSVFSIALFFAGFYVFRGLLSVPLAALVAYLGPKHAILLSNLLFIPSLVGFAALPTLGPQVLWWVAIFQGISSSLYIIAYNIDFSKVRSAEHAGKELAYMNIAEKFTMALSPLIGGVIAYIYGPQTLIIVSAACFAVAALPLLRTGEPVKSHQRLQFRGFPWYLITRNIGSFAASGLDFFTSGVAWTLFISIAFIGFAANNQVYIINGILLSVVLLATLGASYAIGRITDGRRGYDLLRFSTLLNALVHLLRPFVGSVFMAGGLNVINEVSTSGYRIPFTKGVYDSADLSGRRTTYIGFQEGIACLGAALGAGALAFLAFIFSEQRALEYTFLFTAAAFLIMLTVRFPLYKK